MKRGINVACVALQTSTSQNSKPIICRIFPLGWDLVSFSLRALRPSSSDRLDRRALWKRSTPSHRPWQFHTHPLKQNWQRIHRAWCADVTTAPEGQHRLSWLRWPEGTLGAIFWWQTLVGNVLLTCKFYQVKQCTKKTNTKKTTNERTSEHEARSKPTTCPQRSPRHLNPKRIGGRSVISLGFRIRKARSYLKLRATQQPGRICPLCNSEGLLPFWKLGMAYDIWHCVLCSWALGSWISWRLKAFLGQQIQQR